MKHPACLRLNSFLLCMRMFVDRAEPERTPNIFIMQIDSGLIYGAFIVSEKKEPEDIIFVENIYSSSKSLKIPIISVLASIRKDSQSLVESEALVRNVIGNSPFILVFV